MSINKNISVWRGNSSPPTDFHLWELPDGTIKSFVDNKWQVIISPEILDKIKNNILDLGIFNSSGEAEAYAAKSEICRNTNALLLLYKVGNANGIIIQQVGENNTYQKLIWKNTQYSRLIPVNSEPKAWTQTNMDTLKWNSDENKYDFYYLDKKVSGHTDSIPNADSSKNGLLNISNTDILSQVNSDGDQDIQLQINGVAKSKVRIQGLDISTKSLINNSLNSLIVTSEDKSTKIVYTIKGKTNSDTFTTPYTIDVPKDTSIKTVELADTNATVDINGNIIPGSPLGETALSIVYILVDQSYKIVNINLSKFIEEAEFKDGLQVTDHKVSVKLDTSTEPYISVSSDGIKLSGIKDTVDKMSSIYNGNPELVTPTLSGNWKIYKNDGVTEVTGLSFPIEQGYKAQYTGTWKWNTTSGKKDPISTSGSWGTTLPASGVNSSTYTSPVYTSSATISQTIYAPKYGLMVSGSNVVPASGNDSKSASTSCSFSTKVFYGVNTNSSASGDVTSMLNTLASTLGGKARTINNVIADTSNYYWYSYPKSLGVLTSIIQNGAAPILEDFNKYEVSYTSNSGATFDYYLYVSKNKGAFSNVSLKFE